MGADRRLREVADAGQVLVVGRVADVGRGRGPRLDGLADAPLAFETVGDQPRRRRADGRSLQCRPVRRQQALDSHRVDSTERGQVHPHVALRRCDDDAPLRNGEVPADQRGVACTLVRREADVFRRVPRGVDDTDDSPTGRDRRPLSERPVRGDAGGRLEVVGATDPCPDRRVVAVGVVCDRAHVVRVVMRHCDVADTALGGECVESVRPRGRVDQHRRVRPEQVRARLAGRRARLDLDAHSRDVHQIDYRAPDTCPFRV